MFITIIILASVAILVLLHALDFRFPSHLFEAAVQKPSSAPYSRYRSVAPFVFDSIQGFLQQWPNSYAPNGHSIVAGTIAPATLL